MANLGTVINHGYDDEGYERRDRLEVECECNICGGRVELWSDTEAWTMLPDGKWRHDEYGPAQGECCGLVYVDTFDGCFVLDLREGV